jgi:hypothetical protein
LFPVLEEEMGPLTDFHKKVTTILEMAHIEKISGMNTGLGAPFPIGNHWRGRFSSRR